MAERWRPIAGYEDSYEVSDLGSVRSLDRVDSNGHQWSGRTLKLSPVSARGYRKISLYRDGRPSQKLVHRLVLEAFVGPCPEGMEGCHNDGDTTNNVLANLRWDTHSANNFDIVEHGNHHNAKKTHCKRGHLFEAGNLSPNYKPEGIDRGWRRCRTCATEADAARSMKPRAAWEAERLARNARMRRRYEDGLTIEQVAAEFGMSYSGTAACLRSAGTSIRGRWGSVTA